MFVLLWPWLASSERYLCRRHLRTDPAIRSFEAFAQGTGEIESGLRTQAQSQKSSSRIQAAGELLPPQKLHKEKKNKARIVFQIALPEAARLRNEAKYPLSSDSHHPARRLRFGPGEKVECGADS